MFLALTGLARLWRVISDWLPAARRRGEERFSVERLRVLRLLWLYALYAFNTFATRISRRTLAALDLAIVLLLVLLSTLCARRLAAANRYPRAVPPTSMLPTALVLALVAAAALLGPTSPHPNPATGSTGERATQRPSPARDLRGSNVLLIVIDTMRADRLSFLGYERETTPVLDDLARRSVVFEQARANATRTSPSMASLITGTSPLSHGIIESRSRLPDDLPTLAESLRDAGYDTRAVLGNINVGGPFGFTRGLERVDEVYRHSAIDAKTIVDRAIEMLPSSDNRPWFLWVQLMDPHTPYRAPERHLEAFRGDPVWSRDERKSPVDSKGRSLVPPFARVPDLETLADFKAAYDANVRFSNEQVGRLLGAIRDGGGGRPALVVVTSDHGESLGERGRYFVHGLDAHEEVARVPLIFSHPKLGPRVDASPARLMDVASTILIAAGVAKARLGEGRDLLAEHGREPGPRPETILVAGTPRFAPSPSPTADGSCT